MFLSTLVPVVTVPEDRLTRWHPRFNVDTVPVISTGLLPQPPHTEKLSTAQEVLDRARSLITPKVLHLLTEFKHNHWVTVLMYYVLIINCIFHYQCFDCIVLSTLNGNVLSSCVQMEKALAALALKTEETTEPTPPQNPTTPAPPAPSETQTPTALKGVSQSLLERVGVPGGEHGAGWAVLYGDTPR